MSNVRAAISALGWDFWKIKGAAMALGASDWASGRSADQPGTVGTFASILQKPRIKTLLENYHGPVLTTLEDMQDHLPYLWGALSKRMFFSSAMNYQSALRLPLTTATPYAIKAVFAGTVPVTGFNPSKERFTVLAAILQETDTLKHIFPRAPKPDEKAFKEAAELTKRILAGLGQKEGMEALRQLADQAQRTGPTSPGLGS